MLRTASVEFCITDLVSFFASAARKFTAKLGATLAKVQVFSILTLCPASFYFSCIFALVTISFLT